MTKAANLAALAQGPAFSAYPLNSQTVAHNTATKIAFNTEVFDTNNNFDNATNYRFTPTVAGYYQINLSLTLNGTFTSGAVVVPQIVRNGSTYMQQYFASVTSGNYIGGCISCVLYLNGSTDYVEAYALQNGGSTVNTINGTTIFNGALIRAA